jgi:5'-3' exoribonuclease 2
VAALREYLAAELHVPNLPFKWDLERVIDDWIFLCCFVGNDFLPHLPALEIRENGINTLTALWKDNLPYMGGYVTKDGHIDMQRAQFIMDGLAKQEDAIFRRRKSQEDRREANAKRRKTQEGASGRNGPQDAKWKRHNVDTAASGLSSLKPISSFQRESGGPITHDMVMGRSAANDANVANKSAASILKGLMARGADPNGSKGANSGSQVESSPPTTPGSTVRKRKAALMEDEASTPGIQGSNTADPATPATPAPTDDAPVDTVRLWEEGYADRYYEQKFHADPKDVSFRNKVAAAYVEGLAWVLLYYFQGCPSWEWYYPYHYAPFAKDFVNLKDMTIKFEKGRISKPFEQLMSVLPAASRHAIPDVFHDLMTDEDSEIIDFYPEEFEIDLNGKKFAWQGVAILPFIDMSRLLAAVEKKYPLLSPADAARNDMGNDVLMFSDLFTDLYNDVTMHFYSKKQGAPRYQLQPRTSGGLTGEVEKMVDYVPHGPLEYPLDRKSMPDIEYDRSIRYVCRRTGDADEVANEPLQRVL